MVGGKEDTLSKCYDILSKMGDSIVHCGEVGAGNITKLANQVIVAKHSGNVRQWSWGKSRVNPDNL